MKKFSSSLSLLLAALLLTSTLGSCTNKASNAIDSSEAIEKSTEASVNGTDGESNESENETVTDTDGNVDSTVLYNGKDDVIINASSKLSNQVNAYFSDGERKSFITENQNMLLTYSTDMLAERKVTALCNKEGKPYIENTMDIFVKTASGGTYYASKTVNSAKVSQFAGLNIFRFGYYYYDVRIEDQNFVNDITVKNELPLNIKSVAKEEGLKSKYTKDTLFCHLSGNSVDPQVIFENVSFNTADYNYLAITMKSDLGHSSEADCQFFIKTNESSGYKNVSFDTVADGEYHTYYVYLGNISGYQGTLTDLRLDFSMSYSTSGGVIEIKELKAVNADVNGAPQSLGVARVFHTYSDKLHQELQFAASKDTDSITEVGMITNISENTVEKLIIKDSNGTHTSLDAATGVIEYVAFDIKGVGIFGYILPYDSADSLKVTLDNGVYSIIQSTAPKNGTILASPKGTGNSNDLRMGQRIYTDESHSFDAFMLEAETERNPLSEKNFRLGDDNSSAKYLGYDGIRGCYSFAISGTTFNPAYFEFPNKHFKLSFTVRGDDRNRTLYVMSTTTPFGHLEGAVLLNDENMLIPVPVQVSKNFLGDGEANLYNIDDIAYGESILPIPLEAGSKLSYTLLNLYQNWGKYPLKQLSSVQYFVPYYHLSTGVTETNCLKPWYYTSIARDHWNLPDHRAWSAPFWHTIPGHTGGSQPQHTLGGAHYFLEYTNAEGEKIITENTKNTIVSSGPIYAEVISDYISDDGNIKVSYTHTEMPQSDENRTYYQIKYDVLGDVSIKNFKTDFSFYAVMDQIGKMNYTEIGYLDENNQSRVVPISDSSADKYYTLGNECPYISYFNNPNSNDYVNVSFLIYNSSFTIGGKECNAPFVLVDRGQDDMEKISLTLDLGETVLKAGDSFTINAILMPWGSQLSDYSGDAPDKNVRDVRENSLLDPFRAEAVADCEVVESVFIPTLRTTNGKSAEFTISGGENNTAVIIGGFEKLTSPKIYELIDGEWQEYTVSSKDTPDNNGYIHYYDGYGIAYESYGSFSYSFITTMEGNAKRTFRIAAEDDFTRWPEEKIDTSNTVNVYKNPDNLHAAASVKTFFEKVELMEDGSYLRLVPKETASEAYFTAFTGDGEVTGQYLVFQYRLPSTNVVKKDTIEIFAGTANASETGGDNFNLVLSNDGEWHIAIVDLTKAPIPNGFLQNNDESYSVKYIRFDPFNGKTPTTESFDIAFMALMDDLSKLSLINTELEFATLYEGNKRTDVETATGAIIDSNASYIHPDSDYKSSTLAYASHLDMICGSGGASASYSKRGGNSVSGIDIFDYNRTTIDGSMLIFSGWTVAEGGIEKYVWSADGGKTWHDATLVGRELGKASKDHLSLASSWFLGGYTFSDGEASLVGAVYQSPTGLGDGTKGVAADLSALAGETLNVTFAAVPLAEPDSLCLIAHVRGVEVLQPKGSYIHPGSGYKSSSVAYATHLDMIGGKGEGDAASYSMRGGNSLSGIDTFVFDRTTTSSSMLVFSGWTVAEGGIKKYVWSADGGKTWIDAEPIIITIGKASSAHLDMASSKFLDGYKFLDTTASCEGAVYQSPTGLGEDTKGLGANLSEYVGQTVDVIFAAVPKAEPDSLCLIARVTGVEVIATVEQ